MRCFGCLEADKKEKGKKMRLGILDLLCMNTRCCNSCQELKEAYQDLGMPYFHVLDSAAEPSLPEAFNNKS